MKLPEAVRLLALYTGQQLKTRWEYRTDLVAAILVELARQAALLIMIFVVFSQVTSLGGWSRAEILFIYGYFLLPWSIYNALAGQLWDFGERFIVQGELDRLLTRPVPSLWQLILEGIEVEPLIGLATGGVIMVTGGRAAGIMWQWWDAPLLAAGVLGSLLVYLGVYTSIATEAFFSDGKSQLQAMVVNINQQYGRYPVDFYSRPLRFVLTWLLPFAFVGAYPAAYFLRRGPWLLWACLTPFVGLGCLAVALWLWRKGLTRYHGAGS